MAVDIKGMNKLGEDGVCIYKKKLLVCGLTWDPILLRKALTPALIPFSFLCSSAFP